MGAAHAARMIAIASCRPSTLARGVRSGPPGGPDLLIAVAGAQPEDEPAAGEPLQGFGGLGDQRGPPERHPEYPGHDADARGAGRDPGEQRLGLIRRIGPDRVTGGGHRAVAEGFGGGRVCDRVIEGGHEVITEGFGGDRVRDRVVPRCGTVRDADPDQQRIHDAPFDRARRPPSAARESDHRPARPGPLARRAWPRGCHAPRQRRRTSRHVCFPAECTRRAGGQPAPAGPGHRRRRRAAGHQDGRRARPAARRTWA